MAGLLGMRGDEILPCFAHHQVALPFCEADAIRLFLHDLGAIPHPSTEASLPRVVSSPR
jgi:hypothetical protein